MGFSTVFARGVHLVVGSFPHDYATKIARKIRKELVRYQAESTPLASPRGDLYVPGVRRSLGTRTDVAEIEPETIAWFDQTVQPGEVVWDVGSNVGLFACYFGKNEAVRVYAFEPFAHAYVALTENLNRNGVSGRVLAANCGLGETSTLRYLEIISTEPGYTDTTEQQGRAVDGIGRQGLITFRADDFARLFDAWPNHLKIDVDGAELSVLKGAPEVLARTSSVLLEVEGTLLANFNETARPLLAAAGLAERDLHGPASGRMRLFVRAEG